MIDSAHKEGKWAGMCGEMAGDQTAVPLLVGLGLDEFSMSASSVLKTRSLISKLTLSDISCLCIIGTIEVIPSFSENLDTFKSISRLHGSH